MPTSQIELWVAGMADGFLYCGQDSSPAEYAKDHNDQLEILTPSAIRSMTKAAFEAWKEDKQCRTS